MPGGFAQICPAPEGGGHLVAAGRPAGAGHRHEVLSRSASERCRHTVIAAMPCLKRFFAHRRESETEPTRKNFLGGMQSNTRCECIAARIAREQ
jgi:hypothetical protein